MLARDIRAELRQLGKERADRVAGLLVAAGQLVDEDPARALNHARAARELGSRVGVVREAVGLSAYHAGEWAEAARELRAAARITGSASYLPVIADCERALGRPERAIDLARGDEAKRLTTAERVELAIVEAGARRDLGQLDAARLTLEDADLARGGVREWSVRLWYAYADTLLALDRREEAAEWFRSVVAVDEEASTDAEERLAELEDGRPGEEE